MAAIDISVDGAPVTSHVVFARTSFNAIADGQPGMATVVLDNSDRSIDPADLHAGATLRLLVDGDCAWDGWVFGIGRSWPFSADDTSEPLATPRLWTLTGYDRNLLFQRRILYRVDDPADNEGLKSWPEDTPDKTAIEYALDHYVDMSGDGITWAIEEIASPGPFERFTLGFVSAPLGVLFEDAAEITGGVYFIGPDRVGRYVDDLTVTAPFILSDVPGPGRAAYREMMAHRDFTECANEALVWGAGMGSDEPVFAKYTDVDSEALHGLWQWGELYVGAWKQQTVNRRARTYVEGSPSHRRGHNDPVPVIDLVTFEHGLRVGHVATIESEVWGFSDDLPIRRVGMTFPTPDSVRYEVQATLRVDMPLGIDRLRLPPWERDGMPQWDWLPPEGPSGGAAGTPVLIDHFDRLVEWWSKEVIKVLSADPNPWLDGIPLPVVPGGARVSDTILIISISDPFIGDGSSGQPDYHIDPEAFGEFEALASVPLEKSGNVAVLRRVIDGTEPGYPDILIRTTESAPSQVAVYLAREAEAVAIDGDVDGGKRREYDENLLLDLLEPVDYPDDERLGLIVTGYRGYHGEDVVPASTGHLTGTLNKWDGMAYVPDLGWSVDHSRLVGISQAGFPRKGAYLIASRGHDLPLGAGWAQFREVMDLWPYPDAGNLGATIAVGLLPGPLGTTPFVQGSPYEGGNLYEIIEPDFTRTDSRITTTGTAALRVRDYLRLPTGVVTDPTPEAYPEGPWSQPGGLRFEFSFTSGGGDRDGRLEIVWQLLVGDEIMTAECYVAWSVDGGDVAQLVVGGNGTSVDLVTGSEYNLGILHVGGEAMAKVWEVGTAEPDWQVVAGTTVAAFVAEDANMVTMTLVANAGSTSLDAWYGVGGASAPITTDIPVYDNDLVEEAGLYVTRYPYMPGSLVVYLEGIRLRLGVDYVETDPSSGQFRVLGDRDVSSSLNVTYTRAGTTEGTSGGGVYRPASILQYGWGTPLDGYNSVMACSAMALDRHTQGAYTAYEGDPRSTPPIHRSFQPDQSGPAGLDAAVTAWSNGWDESLYHPGDSSFAFFASKVQEGRGAILEGTYADLPAAKRFSSFGGAHALFVNERFENGNFLGYDPLYRYPVIYTTAELQAYAAAAGLGMASAAYTQVTT